MSDKIKMFKMRRMRRILNRMDDDSDGGRWVTTENDHRIHINEKGVPDKGNPYVIATMTGKKARVGLSDKQRKIASLLGNGFDSVDPIKKELADLPVGSTFMLRIDGGWGDDEIRIIKKMPVGDHYIDAKTGEIMDDEDLAITIEGETVDHEFDLYTPDENINYKRDTSYLEELIDKYPLDGGDDQELRDNLEATFSDASEGSVIKFTNGDSIVFSSWTKGSDGFWYKPDGDWMDDYDMASSILDDTDFASEPGNTGGVVYDELPHLSPFLEGHHQFYDRMVEWGWRPGMEYEGDGQDAVDFFDSNSNYDELIDNMDLDQSFAFEQWTEGHFMGAQQHLGWDRMDKEDQDTTRCMDQILDQATLDQGVVVSRLSNASLVLGRKNKNPLLSELRAMKGKKVVSKGAMSCGAAAEGLLIGSRDKLVEYKIAVPAGTGYGMWAGDERINGWEAKQREFVLNRDMEYEVGDTTFDSSRNIFVVELKVSKKLEHDYGEDGI